jgi:tetratricopeptide (TPR) repeat protein
MRNGFGLVWLLGGSVFLFSPLALALPFAVGQSHEAPPPKPQGALEQDLSGPAAVPYAEAMAILAQYRPMGIGAKSGGVIAEALPLLRKARALAYKTLREGPLGVRQTRAQAFRHFVRLAHLEEEMIELLDLERQLVRSTISAEERALYQQERAMVLHNLFLALRSYRGQASDRLLGAALAAYEESLLQGSPLKPMATLGLAGLLAERGDLREAKEVFLRLTPQERENERVDLPMAYYHLACGDMEQALSRLQVAAGRDSWDHPSTSDGRSVRTVVYRMNDFDRLRQHPLFYRLVTEPEEQAAGIR